ncbi:TRAP transporter large permease [Halomonas eurihalina]|uniref:TRAP transporter large permease protein n=1 Tax=Halomonas eurihalina TaxID=42566 RepID=A0A5D9D411_HALER|nr:TRAP transporter large permease [Halomonas eurihalina]MDR5858820.1 TRAP transporter large permease [Halomonas eurihalina]TZG38958.1 TRAP transporter large permease [Halomonas eurihalina]
MTIYIIGFVITFLLVMASGLPVGFGLGFLGIALLTTYIGFDAAASISVEKAYAAMDSSILVAIPLFVLAAQLISETGMGKRLFDAAKSFLWWSKSGLGIATISSSGVFSAMTGSSFVSASTMGLIATPELRRAGYSDSLIAASITAGGSLGSVIPPSIVMIIYGYLTDESIGKLFMAGIVPGIMLILLYSFALSFFISRNYRSTPPLQVGAAATRAESVQAGCGDENSAAPVERMSKRKALKEAFWGLMAPVIILGGIYLGVFTASEAAAIAVIYCMLIGFFVYRTLTIKKLINILMEAAAVSAMVGVIVVGGAVLGHVVSFGRIPQQLLETIVSLDLSPLQLMLLINLCLFLLGMFLEVMALMYLAIPLLVPVIAYMEWDNVWFAVIMLLNVNLALITPPMGGVLFVVSHIGSIPIVKVMKGALLPISMILLVLLLVVLFPSIATWIPSNM